MNVLFKIHSTAVANKRIRKISRTEIFRVLISSDRKCDAILEIVYSATVPLSLTKITASIKNEEILQLQRAAYVAIYSNNNYVKYKIPHYSTGTNENVARNYNRG